MKLRNIYFLVPACAVLLMLSCEESLPVRVLPPEILEVETAVLGQGLTGYSQYLQVTIVCRNIYEEVLHDSAALQGTCRIWLKNKPSVGISIPVNNAHLALQFTTWQDGMLIVPPGELVVLDIKWYLNLENGRNLHDYLDWSNSTSSDEGVLSEPEPVMFDASFMIFKYGGFLEAGPGEFMFRGWRVKQFD